MGKRSPKRLPWGCCYIAVIFGVVFFFAGGFVYLSVGGYPSAEYRADYPMWYLEQQEKRLKEIGSTLGSLLGLSLASFVAAAVFAYFSSGPEDPYQVYVTRCYWRLREQLGRAPTDEELREFLRKGPRPQTGDEEYDALLSRT